MRNDESVLIHIRERDCVAIEAKYHKKCYQKYTKSLSNTTREKAETGPVVYDKAFDLFCADIVQKRIIDDKEILQLSCLLKRFISYIRDSVDVPYQAARLKKRIQSRYPQVVFHSSKTKNKGTLVYSDDIVPGDIADDIMEIDHAMIVRTKMKLKMTTRHTKVRVVLACLPRLIIVKSFTRQWKSERCYRKAKVWMDAPLMQTT